MSALPSQLHLNVFITGAGHHEASWRLPGTAPERVDDVHYFREIAQTAERGKFDSIFFADVPAVGRHYDRVAQSSFEPLTLLSALALVTERIGLIGTVSTTYTEPYNLARQFASLDHISRGRAGWNIVTSWSSAAAYNFGVDGRPGHSDRYTRAAEFLDVATALWDSWEDDAVVLDRDAGVYADASRVHRIDHAGTHFRVRGPLDAARSPQGRPVLVQAGSSADGRAFAARYAEGIFTAQVDLDDARVFYRDVKRQAAEFGRDPEAVKILPGLSPIVASTEAEARRIEQDLADLSIPEVGLAHLSARFDDVDLSGFPLDGPVPLHALPRPEDVQGAQSRSRIIFDLVERKPGLTLRELLHRLAGARGHGTVVGTPEHVADRIVAWFEAGAADGFNIMPPYLPGSFEVFVDEVVPILQRRVVFRTEYEGTTLRDHYGLSRPAGLFSQVPAS